ncbi:hypothetical protein [Nocardia fluminea]|uniref:hypothetical protein n=1 Tax=Nocardia fluminea TaxID=134984 RepID=UPI00379A1BE1
MIVVGIDPSLTGTGIAVLTANGKRIDTALRTVGSTGKRSDTWAMRAARLVKLRNEVMRHIPLPNPAEGVDSVLRGGGVSWCSSSSHVIASPRPGVAALGRCTTKARRLTL